MALAGTGALMGSNLAPLQPKAERVLRLAHLTDVHLRDADNAPEKFIKCLHIMQSLKDKPDMIFNGGDTIFDALGTDKVSVENQWQLWDKVIKAENDLPIVNCIGN
ncbi:MAG: Icc protein, partial [Roseivirga sp.]